MAPSEENLGNETIDLRIWEPGNRQLVPRRISIQEASDALLTARRSPFKGTVISSSSKAIPCLYGQEKKINTNKGAFLGRNSSNFCLTSLMSPAGKRAGHHQHNLHPGEAWLGSTGKPEHGI